MDTNKLALIEMKNRISQFLIIYLTVLAVSSCNSKQEFDSDEWKQTGLDWWMTDFREKMVDDLIQNDTLIGMNQEQVIELLGLPESENKAKLEYLIREKYGSDIDPEYISNLIIEFDEKGQVRNCKIEK
jgi:aromatic ring-opening dioxygenase catalytic subunit (LigB family)|tara:strand:- start:2752 stop:3138 length:387 start_codon:yes stop_codon:yes gene_type:complete